MAQFLGDIAGMLEIFSIAAGLVLLHRASKEAPAPLLKAAGLVLVVGGVAVGLCTSWYWLKYQRSGVFDAPAHWHMGTGPGAAGPMGSPMHPGPMHRGPMPGSSSRSTSP